MWGVLRVYERVGELERRFFPDAVISVEALDPFKSTSWVTHRGGIGASTSNALA